MDFKLTSTSFEAGQTIPTRYTCEGDDISPQLSWTGTPPGTRSLALICEDPDAPRGLFTHWVLYNMPSDQTQLPEALESDERTATGRIQGRNDFGNTGYGGPCPPHGDQPHRYFFRLYALSKLLPVTLGTTRQQILDQMQGAVLAQTEWMGTFGRR
jgi:Raf kinase inhibitor-like YbhB/YbcL family protein